MSDPQEPIEHDRVLGEPVVKCGMCGGSRVKGEMCACQKTAAPIEMEAAETDSGDEIVMAEMDSHLDGPKQHPSVTHIMQYFEARHLPPKLAPVSMACGDLARLMVSQLPPSPELTVGLRKLLEAKDAFVRAALAGGE